MLKDYTMDEEIWKDIKGYDGKYQVSNLGRVRSFKYNKERILQLHEGRHYFITKMVRMGVRPDELIKMTGHATTLMVQQVYTHLNSEDRCSIVANAVTRK